MRMVFFVECCFLPLKEEKSLPSNLEETEKPNQAPTLTSLGKLIGVGSTLS